MKQRNEPVPLPHNPDRKLPIPAGAFTALCQLIHEFNHQWWIDPATGQPKDRNVGEMLMLMTSELAEAMEAHRKNLMDDKLLEFHGIDVELVDCIIRAMDLLGYRYKMRQLAANDSEGIYSPGDVLYDKCHYNAKRLDHRPEHRLSEHGKKY